MKIQVIKCDVCGREIANNPIHIIFEEINRDNDDLVKTSENSNIHEKDLTYKRRKAPSWDEIKILRDKGKSIGAIAKELESTWPTINKIVKLHEDSEESEKNIPIVPEKKSDNTKKDFATKYKPSPPEGTPLKVCTKTCAPCEYSKGIGYCDYSTITGKSRGDKPGICTHRKLR